MDEFKQLQLQQTLLSLGNFFVLNKQRVIETSVILQQIQSFEQHFQPYNPRKKGYNRYGLSLTSKDGGFSGIPDLDSLTEYNKENNTHWAEKDFREQTPLFKSCKNLQTAMVPFLPHMGRSHILRLNKGGFFPFHRDSVSLIPQNFRLLFSLTPSFHFVFLLDDKRIFLDPGYLYFINTCLAHSIFSYEDKSDFIVFNIDLCEESVRAVIHNLAFQ